MNEKVIEMERNIHREEQYSRRKCIKVAGIPSSITNNLLEKHVLLILEKIGVVIKATDIVVRHRLEKGNRVIVKLLK